MPLRLIGGILVITGATAVGAVKARRYYSTLTLLKELERGMELVRTQMHYTLYPIPKLLDISGSQLKGAAGTYFKELGNAISNGVPRHLAYREAMALTGELSLPDDALMALIEWSETLGHFDPEGENALMKISIDRLHRAYTDFCEDKSSMVKSYTLLGASAGISLLILMI